MSLLIVKRQQGYNLQVLERNWLAGCELPGISECLRKSAYGKTVEETPSLPALSNSALCGRVLSGADIKLSEIGQTNHFQFEGNERCIFLKIRPLDFIRKIGSVKI